MFHALALLFSLIAGSTQVAAGPVQVDVEILLAVDVSGSIDIEEAQMQRSGYVEALRHPDFISAVRGGMLGRIAIAYFEWAGVVDEQSVVNWQLIEDPGDAEEFAEKIDKPITGSRRGTSLSNAILFATASIESNVFSGARRVLDISGDGPNNAGPEITPARDAALERGIIINGLAVLIRPSVSFVALDRYYEECVIGGPGSFVLPIHEPQDFAVSIRQKLILEVSGSKLAPLPKAAGWEGRPDCLTVW
ncbi:DUF1194 domain-containing protein [Sinorhizobium meliloti]|uniref:DUF1194 domain-containing protein n=1 Tax=Rhizobium meliloti TaxID=382 RepID=UPI0020914754|nr:DUF1194 domain-containing protein [Sinorhizobium meliloti]MCO5963681.1 DUF1194 domain-containing protein [Sinorhizobium meliloti]